YLAQVARQWPAQRQRHGVLADLALERVDGLVVGDDALRGTVVAALDHVQRGFQLRRGHFAHAQDLADDAVALLVVAANDVVVGLGGHGRGPGFGIRDWGFGRAGVAARKGSALPNSE